MEVLVTIFHEVTIGLIGFFDNTMVEEEKNVAMSTTWQLVT